MVSGRPRWGSRSGRRRSLWMHRIVAVARTNQGRQSERNNNRRVSNATVDRRARPQPFTGRDKARRNDFCRPHGDRRQKRRQGRYRGAHAWGWRASGSGRRVSAAECVSRRDQSHCRSGWRTRDSRKRVTTTDSGLCQAKRISGTLRATWNSDTLAGDPWGVHFLGR